MLLRVVPKGWFSYDFSLLDATEASVGEVDLSNWRERAKLEVGGKNYEAHHGSWDKEFVLTSEDGRTVVVAKKPSAFKGRFSFEHDGHRYELKKESVWKSDLVLAREDLGTVGHVRRKSAFFKREWETEIPDELPSEVGAFIVWLAALLARRADSAAASSATSGG